MPRWPWSRKEPEGDEAGFDQNAADRQVIDQLTSHGADLSKPTEVIHYLYLPDEQSAGAANAEAEQAGYRVQVRPPDADDDPPLWSLQAEREMVVSAEAIGAERERLTAIAERLGGEYDGWEAAVTR